MKDDAPVKKCIDMEEHKRMLNFVLRAFDSPDPFMTQRCMNKDVEDALEWVSVRTAADVNMQREEIISALERQGLSIVVSVANCCLRVVRDMGRQ